VVNIKKPLLRCVSINGNTKQMSYESSGYIHHVPLCKDHIDDVRIWISDTYMGKPIQTVGNIYIRLDFVQLA
jgi:hypothetical protein